tara:strand:+ start:76416 stop:77303 length:888 start_codon:yes stop_codon:yes gene_type:complete
MAIVNPGYTGFASVGGTNIRFTDANIAAKQDINAPDMVMGHWDHNAYVFNQISIDGSISGYVTETFADAADGLWTWATNRANAGACGELETKVVDLYYFCDTSKPYGFSGRTFPGMLANSINVSVTAGDIANFSIDVIGDTLPTDTSTSTLLTDEEKLVTWDVLNVTVVDGQGATWSGDEAFSAFDITIGNNIEAVYAIGEPDLTPFALVPGLRSINGSLTAYNAPNVHGADTWTDYLADSQGTLSFSLPTSGGGITTFNILVQFHRVEATAQVGPITSTISFTGVGDQSGTLDT